MIGGEYCRQGTDDFLYECEPRLLKSGDAETEKLWEIFLAINHAWGLIHTLDKDHPVADASNLRSTWLEFIKVKTSERPSYADEYVNAIAVVEELKALYGGEAFDKLFFDNGLVYINLPRHDHAGMLGIRPSNNLAHAKYFVVDEFISVMVVASGFKEFAGRNYNGYIAGSRFDQATFINTRTEFPKRQDRK